MVSNSQVKTTTSKSLNWRSLLFDRVLGIESLLGLALNLFAALLLVVFALHILKFTSKTFNFVLILVNLSLIHVQLCSHCLHLSCFLLEILLIDRELLSYFRTGLSSKQILQLNVKFLLLLNNDILLNNLFSFLDQTFLKSLNLLKHFPSVRISSLKLSPSMVVERVLEFLRESLNLKSLCEKLLL